MKIAIFAVWFGDRPPYWKAWIKSLSYISDRFHFFLITDMEEDKTLCNKSKNLEIIHMNLVQFKEKIETSLQMKVNLRKAYRICDFRPMFGKIFADLLFGGGYTFWGHTDLDVVFGNIDKFVTDDVLADIDILFNGGHFTLYRNVEKCNDLYRQSGALFPWNKVVSRDATFAFDEVSGMYRIARKNKINAKYGIISVDCDQRYLQLRHRMEESQPDYQCFYWENGHVMRVSCIESDGKIMFQEVCYIHIPQRNLGLVNNTDLLKDSFWITPNGFEEKNYLGLPNSDDIISKNPFMGTEYMKRERKNYRIKKVFKFIKKGPYQIYIRVKQHYAGMTKAFGKGKGNEWISS